MEIEVELEDGTQETLFLEEKVPAKIGRKTRMKINADAEGGEDSPEEYVIKDAVSTIEKVKMYLVKNMLDYSNCDVDIDDLTLESYDKVAKEYWPQIQGKKKVNEQS